MEIQYDVPIEVTDKQYRIIMRDLGGVCAGMRKDGKTFIKVWIMSQADRVRKILERP